MASLNEGVYTGEFILAESPGTISRAAADAVVTVAGLATLVPGQVLGKLSATGKYVVFDETATDGSETAAGVLYNELDNSGSGSPADFDAVILDWSCEVRAADLEWGTASSADGLPDLAALGVKAR